MQKASIIACSARDCHEVGDGRRGPLRESRRPRSAQDRQKRLDPGGIVADGDVGARSGPVGPLDLDTAGAQGVVEGDAVGPRAGHVDDELQGITGHHRRVPEDVGVAQHPQAGDGLDALPRPLRNLARGGEQGLPSACIRARQASMLA